MVDKGINPKDAIGIKKVNTFVLPPLAQAYGAHAMMDGAVKYGPYNWRDKSVIASIYIAAACRHIMYWQEGEERAKDSGVHHLGHAIACLAIIIDAQATDHLKDDRQGNPAIIEALDALNKLIGEAVEKRNLNQPLRSVGDVSATRTSLVGSGGTMGQ